MACVAADSGAALEVARYKGRSISGSITSRTVKRCPACRAPASGTMAAPKLAAAAAHKLKTEFISTVQQRGAAIIKARGFSSAASAANAVVDSVRSIVEPTPAGDWHSVCVCADGSYGVEAGLISGFPMRSDGQRLQIVPNLPLDSFSRARIDATVSELK